MRDTTERPEGVAAGTLRLVGTDEQQIYAAVRELLTTDPAAYHRMEHAVNPYGDGKASRCISGRSVSRGWPRAPRTRARTARGCSGDMRLVCGRLPPLGDRPRGSRGLVRLPAGSPIRMRHSATGLMARNKGRAWRCNHALAFCVARISKLH